MVSGLSARFFPDSRNDDDRQSAVIGSLSLLLKDSQQIGSLDYTDDLSAVLSHDQKVSVACQHLLDRFRHREPLIDRHYACLHDFSNSAAEPCRDWQRGNMRFRRLKVQKPMVDIGKEFCGRDL